MAASYLQHHMDIAHGKVLPQVRGVDIGGGVLEVYKVSFLRILRSVDCPMEGCLSKAKKKGRLRDQFIFRHCKSKVAILHEGPKLSPRCDQFRMHTQADRLFKHKHLNKCHKSTEIRIRRRDVEMASRCGEIEFNLDGEEVDERVENVPTFRYMGRPLYQTDDDWTAVQRNIMHARSVRGSLGTII